MNLRPRCRKWLPLATQQLRLRNLARIQGFNIVSGPQEKSAEQVEPEDVLLYYTLHTDKDSGAFYTSEKLPQRHQQQKWAEICADDEAWRKTNAQCVCVKVWKHYPAEPRDGQPAETDQRTKEMRGSQLRPSRLPRPPELLFSWGVYFSGLIPLSPLTLSQCGQNCLVFQLNGEQFASPSMISEQGLQSQLHLHYQNYAADEELEEPQDGGINSPAVSRSSSPVLRMSTMRYAQLKCQQQEIRRSNNLDKLLMLQRLQRLHQQKMRQMAEVCREIARLSVHCVTKNELRLKPRTTSLSGDHSAHHHHSMGRALSVLLAEQQLIAPLTLYNAQQLTRRIEALSSQQRLLKAERETFRQRNDRARQRLEEMREQREALQQQLHSQRHRLEQERLELRTQSPQLLEQRDQRRQIVRQVERRMSTLVLELQEIYNIQNVSGQQFSICGIAFPHMDQYTSDSRQAANAQLLENVSPLAVSAALGYVAHLVQMLSIIMDRPLRNRILYEPSRARIVDDIKELTYTTREFPLYTRSILPSQQTKYAIYLLRQNVNQLCNDITGHCDLRNTFGNLLNLFRTLRYIERSQRDEIDERDGTSGGGGVVAARLANGLTAPHLSESHSSVDMNHVPLPTNVNAVKDALLQQLLPPGVSQTLAIEGYASTQRICRSVGSYSDGEDEFRPRLEHNYSNSDSNITLQTERS
ncbi:UV radiation resistance-associated gene protein isoform X2 [Drosophila biarmipes]|uniref:UV radiation resistance-associated gene protein isoform X2 n=1 Tax=Drosophila biarmipes TaxID=125945 RepID=UPI0007E6D1BF|nr:UV radiation resistance-associated gene protein isoform X2 [Drosophila biarmipes]